MEDDFELAGVWAHKHFAPNDPGEWAGTGRYWWWELLIGKRRGTAAEYWLMRFLSLQGFSVETSKESSDDGYINGVRVEIKCSAGPSRTVMARQIRDQDYELCLILWLAPVDQRLWVIPKEVVWAAGQNMHGGKDVESGTRALQFNVDDPEWSRFGGTLQAGVDALRSYVGPGFKLRG